MSKSYAGDLVQAVRLRDLSIKGFFSELKYWYVKRQTRKFVPWLATKLPTKLKYYVVIHGMVTVEPKLNPISVTGEQLLKLWGKGVE